MPFSVNNIPCVDPDSIRAASPPDDCNSYTCPVGYETGFARVLMWRSDYERLPAGRGLTLRATDGFGRTVTIKGLQAVGRSAALQAALDRLDCVVVATLADLRWSYKLVPAAARYNYRDAAGTFITATTNAGTPWTWQGVINSLWGKLTAVFGSATAPTMPAGVTGTPEGFDFTGRDVWWALNRVCQAAGCVLVVDPTRGTITIVDVKTNATAIPRNAARTYDDGVDARDDVWGNLEGLPAVVQTAFPVVNREFPHTVDAATVRGGTAGMKAVVWDDLPAFSPTNNTALTNRANAISVLYELDYLKAANRRTIEFVGWESWVTDAAGKDGWSQWAVYNRGDGSDASPGGLLTAVTNGPAYMVCYEPTPDRYLPAGGSTLTTANVDTTEESTTTRLEFDQATGVRVDAGATDADPDVVSLDLSGLFTENVDVLTQGCLELTLNKTYSTTPGETHLLTNVSITHSLVFKKRTLGLLEGTTVGSVSCIAAETECCVVGPTFAGCARQFPGTIYVTMSGPTGTCGCFTGAISLDWDDTYGVAGGYIGTFGGCAGAVDVFVVPDADPPTTWNVFWSSGSYTFDSGLVSQFFAFVCDPIASGTLAQTIVAGCAGSYSFVVSE